MPIKLVLAGPGTGKTTCIAKEIQTLLRNGTNKDIITALTFSNAATNEMIRKLEDLEIELDDQPSIRTLHSLAKWILHENSTEVGIRRDFSVTDLIETIIVLEDVAADLKIKKGCASRLHDAYAEEKARAIPSEGIFQSGVNVRDKDWTAFGPTYDKLLRLYNAVDWWDVIHLANDLLARHPEFAAKYSKQCKYLLVDEYQDLNLSDRTLIHVLASQACELLCFGDDDQCLYESARFADPRGILSFSAEYTGAIVDDTTLCTCHRCPPEILEPALALIKNNPNRTNKSISCSGTTHGVLRMIKFKSAKAEKEYLAKLIKKRLKDGLPADQILVIFPTRDIAREYAKHFADSDLPTVICFQEQAEIRDSSRRKARVFIRVARNRHDGLALRQCFDYIGLTRNAINIIRSVASAKGLNLWDAARLVASDPGKTKLRAPAPKKSKALSR